MTAAGGDIRCAGCGQAVADAAARVEVDGRHAHAVTNPAGVAFELRLYHPAPGAVGAGPATRDDTWFAGHSWQRAFCRGCSRHVGWLFRGKAQVFTALIADRVA